MIFIIEKKNPNQTHVYLSYAHSNTMSWLTAEQREKKTKEKEKEKEINQDKQKR